MVVRLALVGLVTVGATAATVRVYVCVANAFTPNTAAWVAVIVVVPTVTPVIRPVVTSTVATAGALLV